MANRVLFLVLALLVLSCAGDAPRREADRATKDLECHYFNVEKMMVCLERNGGLSRWEVGQKPVFIPVGRQVFSRDGDSSRIICLGSGGGAFSLGAIPGIPLEDGAFVWVWPSQLDGSGQFRPCLDCPIGTKREYLKAQAFYERDKEHLRTVLSEEVLRAH